MYKINKLQHRKRFIRDFHTRWFGTRNLTRLISDTSPTHVKIPYARAFREVISISKLISFLLKGTKNFSLLICIILRGGNV